MNRNQPEHTFPDATSVKRATSSRTSRAHPDIEALRGWLLSDAVLGQDGTIFSWSNPKHPGYPYPEAAGLFLSTLCTGPHVATARAPAVDRVAGWLCRSIGPDGGVGRGSTTYLFDSAVALTGLLRYRSVGGRVGGDGVVRRLRDFVCDRIGAGDAVLPSEAAAEGRWSTQFGAHLVKCLQSLHLYSRAFGERVPDDLVAALINRSGQQPSPVYVHPFCYEQEGHSLAAHYGLASLFEPLEGALDWLVALQQPDGAILAFANGMEGFGEPRSDATAQAVRLWLLRDRRRYAEAIAQALAFLAACQTPQGGIRYAPGSDDVCSWSTMFTLQAVEWFVDQPRPDDLL